ncbi:MAG: hypothetical protein ACOY94_19605 [Bacillota bacterium]
MMLDRCRAILTSALAPLGLKETITEEKDAGKLKPTPYAVLLWGDEDLQRSRRRLGHTDDLATGTRTIHRQVARRTIWLIVRLVAETTTQLDGLVTQLVANLPPRVQDPELGTITVSLRGAETPVAEGVIRRQAQWEGTIEFVAPVLGSTQVRLFNLETELALQTETEQ